MLDVQLSSQGIRQHFFGFGSIGSFGSLRRMLHQGLHHTCHALESVMKSYFILFVCVQLWSHIFPVDKIIVI